MIVKILVGLFILRVVIKAYLMVNLRKLEKKRNTTNLENKALIRALNGQIERLVKFRRQWWV